MTDVTGKLTTALAGRYKIERRLGEGGMATVYLAEDLKHDRHVAVKVLRPELAAVLGAERFVQEIKTTAGLQHPHILPLFDSGEADGFLFYVMPFIDGETLRDRLNREAQLGIEESVQLTRDVANALDYAHRSGVIHRDIKPENILLHDGRPMVADFGIALAVSAAAGGRMTETGLSLGTPHYMSPEQATAEKELSARSDVYSLASVLYEMLTGEPPHTGATAQAIVMKIVTDTARPVNELRRSVPPNVAAAVAKGLEKLPADRFDSAKAFAEALGDVGFTIGATAAAPGAFPGRAAAPRRSPAVIGLGAATVVLLVAAVAGWLRAPEATVTRHEITLPPISDLAGVSGVLQRGVALAPDGSSIVFANVDPGGRLMVKPRDALEATPLAGTEGGLSPFFSPDGAWIGFLSEGRVRKVPRGGGGVITLSDVAGTGTLGGTASLVDGTWADDGSIYFIDRTQNLLRVSDVGGEEEIIVSAFDDFSVTSFTAQVSALPDGRGVLFTICNVLCTDATVFAWDARTKVSKVLFEGAVGAWYLPSGHVMYGGAEGGAFAATFDLATFETGPAVPVIEGARPPDVVVGADGTLLYVLGGSQTQTPLTEAVWVDLDGRVTAIDDGLEFLASPVSDVKVAPDGSRLAFGMSSEGAVGIWLKDLTRANGPVSRLTFGANGEIVPRWSPDSRHVYFSTLSGPSTVYRKSADGLGTVEPVVTTEKAVTVGLPAPDGETVILRVGRGAANVRDILTYRPGVDSAAQPLIADPFDEATPSVSPDGRWIAYASTESGRYEVYVRPYPNVGAGRWQISSGGGVDPVWAYRADRLFYLTPSGLVAAEFDAEGEAFRLGDQRELFGVGPEFVRGLNYRAYDLHPDDRRFVFLRIVGQQSALTGRLVLVENWFTELEETLRR